MNPIEAVRQQGATFHNARLVQGGDPWQAKALALAEASERNIEVRSYDHDNPLLQGGRACFDIDAGIIRHERTGSDFMDAFLIAHELAHDELDSDHPPQPATNVDPARSADPSSTGAERVADYSSQSRHEIRMDLFAREFLLPRSQVRRWHVEDRLTASEIAARLGAPFDIVAVQLFDALLLPIVAPEPPKPSTPKLPNPKQIKAAEHRGDPMLLQAGPGTGKTQTLIARLQSLKEDGTNPESILVLTFSNKAAAELTERAQKVWPEAAQSAWIGTFHAFGLDLVRRFHDQLALPSRPRLMDGAEAIELLEHEFARLDLKHFRELWDPTDKLRDLLSAISRAKDEVVSAEHYQTLSEQMAQTATGTEQIEEAERCLEISTVYAAYEALKHNKGYVDFGDLVLLPTQLLESNTPVRESLQNTYEHILVDEYQDVNRASVRLLKALNPSGHNLWVVGDTKQSIYRFRGASSYNLARFKGEDFPGAKTRSLSQNYRSTQSLCDTFVQFARANMIVAESGFSAEAAVHPTGEPAEFVSVGTKHDEINELADCIQGLVEQGYPYKDQAILCKANDRLGVIAQGLEALGIPVLYLGPLFDRPEVKEALALLSLLVDPRAMGLACVATMNAFRLSVEGVRRCASILAAIEDLVPLAWVEHLMGADNVSKSDRTGLEGSSNALKGLSESSSPWQALSAIYLDNTRLGAQSWERTEQGDALPGIAFWQLQNFIRTALPEGEGWPVTRLLDRIRRLVTLSDERDLRNLPEAALTLDAVRLMTMHGAKGLEFPVVHLPSLTKGSLPRSAKQIRGLAPPDGMVEGARFRGIDAAVDGRDEEQECLFFVALSRAERRLLLYAPSQQANGRAQSPSPFIGRLGHTVANRTADGVPATPIPQTADVTLHANSPMVLSPSQLALYDKCPRRFFYTHVLKLGGRRTETPFMKMHAAVQAVADDLLKHPAQSPAGAELDQMFDEKWIAHGPIGHGYETDYRTTARGLVDYLVTERSGEHQQANQTLRLQLNGAVILVRADEHTQTSDGRRVYRRVRSGRQTSRSAESLDAAAYQWAAEGQAVIEFMFLSDQQRTQLSMKERALSNRKERIQEVVDDIAAGLFPNTPDAPERTCPRCPYFFVCTKAPSGDVSIKF